MLEKLSVLAGVDMGMEDGIKSMSFLGVIIELFCNDV